MLMRLPAAALMMVLMYEYDDAIYWRCFLMILVDNVENGEKKFVRHARLRNGDVYTIYLITHSIGLSFVYITSYTCTKNENGSPYLQ